MIDKYIELTKKGIRFIKPYSDKILGFLTAFVAVITASAKKSEKKAKMHIRFIKFKNILEIISNITLIVAGIIAILCAIFGYLRKKDN